MTAHHPDREDLGVRLIVAYKATKAVLEIALAVLLVARAHRPGRIVLVLLNAAVVLYLARRITGSSRRGPNAAPLP